MRKLLLLVLIPMLSHAQKQGNIWYFAEQDGISFATGSPVYISGGMTGSDSNEGQEGSASISDSTGHILFYSGGQTVWNRYNQPMPNGTGLAGGVSSTQAALIVPLPGSSEFFYLFTTDEFQNYMSGTGKGLCYSIIDMCLDSTRGDVVAGSKNILIMDSTSEKLCAVADSQGTGYWVMGRKMFTDEFYAWHLTAGGITDTVISHADTAATFPNGWPMGIGQMKFSSDGTRLGYVVGNYQPPTMYIFDFNAANGIVSNERVINIDTAVYSDAYGFEFSPGGTKAYASEAGALFQYDLMAGGGNADSITASRYPVFMPPSGGLYFIGGLQLGPDGNVYAVTAIYAISKIESADLPGAGAVYVDDAVPLGSPDDFTLPSFIAGYSYHNGLSPCQLPVAGFVQDSTDPNYSNERLFNCIYEPWGDYVFELSSTSQQVDSVSWEITDIEPGEYFGEVRYLSGDIINFNPYPLFSDNDGTDQVLAICMTAYNQYGSNTICDTTCLLWYEGITEIPLSNIKLYPSPADRLLTVDLSQNNNAISSNYAAINLYDALGQKVSSLPRKGNNKIVEVPVSNLPDGIYLATIVDAARTEMMLGKFSVVK